MPTDRDYFEIPHTADLALSVRGESASALLLHAAQGLVSLLHCQVISSAMSAAFDIHLQAPDLETLLVDWLNEILYLVSERSLYPQEFTIHEFGTWSLQAAVTGLTPAPGCRQIKAATFHGLALRQRDGYQATIVFDV